MPAVAKRQAPAVNIKDLLQQTMAEVNGDRDKAINLLRLRTRDHDVNDAFRLLGIQQAIRSFLTDGRHGAIDDTARAPLSPVDAEHVAALNDLRIARRLFWDQHTLWGGRIMLRDANKADLMLSAQSYSKQERASRNAREFHEDLAKRMPNSSKTVSEHMAATKVVELARAHSIIP